MIITLVVNGHNGIITITCQILFKNRTKLSILDLVCCAMFVWKKINILGYIIWNGKIFSEILNYFFHFDDEHNCIVIIKSSLI